MKKVTLATDHVHAGVFYPAGKEFEVDDSSYGWLVDNGLVGGEAPKTKVASPMATDNKGE